MNRAQESEFVEFVSVNSARLLRMAELLIGDRDLAEDLVQTSLLKLYRVWDANGGPSQWRICVAS